MPTWCTDFEHWFRLISSLWSKLQILNQRKKLSTVHVVIPSTGCRQILMVLGRCTNLSAVGQGT